jgi:acyl-CoA synthetase (AMP-forming)/AMP-acid ligase II
VREYGEHTYVVTPTDRLTYREADQRSARIARRMLGRGIGKGTRVGLFLPNGVEWIEWWLAASRIGALVIPLSTLYTPAEIAKVLRLSDIGVLVSPRRVLDVDVAERFEAALPELSNQHGDRLAMSATPFLRSIVLVGEGAPGWARRWDDAETGVPPEVLAAAEA